MFAPYFLMKGGTRMDYANLCYMDDLFYQLSDWFFDLNLPEDSSYYIHRNGSDFMLSTQSVTIRCLIGNKHIEQTFKDINDHETIKQTLATIEQWVKHYRPTTYNHDAKVLTQYIHHQVDSGYTIPEDLLAIRKKLNRKRGNFCGI